MTSGRMGFVGVDTAGSSIQRIFPLWAEYLGLPSTELRGFDIPLGADDDAYRKVVAAIRDDPDQAGALVTTHKMRVFQAAGDMFDCIGDFAAACGEISSIGKTEDGESAPGEANTLLRGEAKDPITAGLALCEIVDDDYFGRTGAELICLGVGGAGLALSWYLAGRIDRPRRIVLAGIRPEEIAGARAVHERGRLDTTGIEYRLLGTRRDGDSVGDPSREAAELVAAAPAGSVIVNATGLGKDRPGSPLPDDVVFPECAVIWEFNYRGSLEFYNHALTQQHDRSLIVVDGWRYFIHGWTQVISDVFSVDMPPDLVEELAALAGSAR